ncbi:MAG: hypothetical protein OEX77_12290 [Candidatus Bathyarchaeota archaeon]|nr:hypothetical protein [Candidatus Bathyarchaeota archaeon]
MRKSLVLTVCVLCLFIVAGVLVLRAPFAAFGIGAAVDIYPETLNLKSSGTWVTVYIELPEGYNVSDINVTTVFLDGTIPADSELWKIGDYDRDGVSDMMVKFDRLAVIDYIWAKLYRMRIDPSSFPKEGVIVKLIITGSLDTETIEGSDTIRVIYQG